MNHRFQSGDASVVHLSWPNGTGPPGRERECPDPHHFKLHAATRDKHVRTQACEGPEQDPGRHCVLGEGAGLTSFFVKAAHFRAERGHGEKRSEPP